MSFDVEQQFLVQGRVKWFDPTKGFGFVTAEGIESDILLHANVLRNFGQGSVADGSAITIRVQETNRGIQAVEVVSIEPPEKTSVQTTDPSGEFVTHDLTVLPIEPARVKWFDKVKGFGFANVFGRPEDVFLHVEVLRHSGFADVQPGEAICLKITEGRRGRMAVQILPWDTALREASA